MHLNNHHTSISDLWLAQIQCEHSLLIPLWRILRELFGEHLRQTRLNIGSPANIKLMVSKKYANYLFGGCLHAELPITSCGVTKAPLCQGTWTATPCECVFLRKRPDEVATEITPLFLGTAARQGWTWILVACVGLCTSLDATCATTCRNNCNLRVLHWTHASALILDSVSKHVWSISHTILVQEMQCS